MGLLSWLFPSAEDKMAKARAALEAGDHASARDAVWGMDQPEAVALREQAENGLVLANLDAARSWMEAGDEDRVRIHLELADELHKGGLEAAFRETRRALRELRAKHQAEEDQRAREEQARLKKEEAEKAAAQ